MRSEVIGFKALSGAHTGKNLGRYAIGLLDRVGIMNEERSKVRHVLTMCQRESHSESYLLFLALYSNPRQHK
jgi:hypothetical protein